MLTGAFVVQRIIAMRPNVANFTLGRRPSGDGTLATTTWQGSAKPADLDMAAAAGVIVSSETGNIELYKESQSVEPRAGDKITDTANVVWEIKHVTAKVGRNVFDCLCIKDL